MIPIYAFFIVAAILFVIAIPIPDGRIVNAGLACTAIGLALSVG